MKTPRYKVSRLFLSGDLAGLTHTEITSVRFDVGWTCEKPIGGGSYRITACVPVQKYCDDPDFCTYADCPTAFCDK